jgi:hypothetical protein
MLALFLATAPADAQETVTTAPPVGHETTVESREHFGETRDFWTPRYEPAGFPIIGGNSDIGFQFGGAGTLTRFDSGVRPYRWNMDLLLTASIKSGTEGTELAQQSYLWQWDLPGMLGGRVRLIPLIYYQRTVNQGYFGLGNASGGADPRAAGGRNYQFVDSEVRVRQMARIAVGGPYQLVVVGTFRAEAPEAYAGTQLERDAAARGDGRIYGVRRLGLAMPAVGVIYDTRDFEIFPHAGAFHQVGVKYAQGLPTDADVQYGAFSANLAWYAPLGQNFVFATRLAGDFQFGNVPFYDLYSGGPFATYDMPGGPSGIRGVPSGRYLGRVKLLGNAELRTLLVDFRLLGTKFRLGGDAFFDTGRVFYDYTFNSRFDGSGLGLKYGTGGGVYLLWGQAALFRIEVAYSPDQVAANPGFPVGVYVEDGVMF